MKLRRHEYFDDDDARAACCCLLPVACCASRRVCCCSSCSVLRAALDVRARQAAVRHATKKKKVQGRQTSTFHLSTRSPHVISEYYPSYNRHYTVLYPNLCSVDNVRGVFSSSSSLAHLISSRVLLPQNFGELHTVPLFLDI